MGQKKLQYTNSVSSFVLYFIVLTMPERIHNHITAMGLSAMFTFQLDNTNRQTLPAPHCLMGVVDTFGQGCLQRGILDNLALEQRQDTSLELDIFEP